VSASRRMHDDTKMCVIVIQKPVKRSRYSGAQTTSWTIEDSGFESVEGPDGLWGSRSILFSGFRGLCQGVKLSRDFRIVLRLRIWVAYLH